MEIKNFLFANWFASISLLIAVLSLIASITTWYFTYLQPFRLNVIDAGRVEITKSPFSNNLNYHSLILDLIFANHGAKRGIISSMAINLRYGDRSILLIPALFVTNRGVNFQQPSKEESGLEPFMGFGLNKEESIIKKIIFIPANENAPLSFNIGSYSIDLYVKLAHKKNWDKYKSIDFTLDKNRLEQLNQPATIPSSDGHSSIDVPLVLYRPTDDTLKDFEELKTQLNIK